MSYMQMCDALCIGLHRGKCMKKAKLCMQKDVRVRTSLTIRHSNFMRNKNTLERSNKVWSDIIARRTWCWWRTLCSPGSCIAPGRCCSLSPWARTLRGASLWAQRTCSHKPTGIWLSTGYFMRHVDIGVNVVKHLDLPGLGWIVDCPGYLSMGHITNNVMHIYTTNYTIIDKYNLLVLLLLLYIFEWISLTG